MNSTNRSGKSGSCDTDPSPFWLIPQTLPRDRMATMAGLLTFVSARGDAVVREEAINAAFDKLGHRGGDRAATATRDVVFAGEPLRYPETGRYLIVFDGAIANAGALREELADERAVTFATGRDVEVIAAAY